MKICTICNQNKQFEDFYKKTSSKDGLRSMCIDCTKMTNKKYYENNTERNRKYCHEYRLNNKDKLNKYYAEWKLENMDKRRESNKKWSKENIEKDRKTKSEYKKRNRDKNCFYVSKRRAKEIMATPKWLSNIHFIQISWFYSASKMMSETSGVKHHVDHIHPLNGVGFSGLHVPWNLRVIKSTENESKGNRPPKEELHLFWPSIPEGGIA